MTLVKILLLKQYLLLTLIERLEHSMIMYKPFCKGKIARLDKNVFFFLQYSIR